MAFFVEDRKQDGTKEQCITDVGQTGTRHIVVHGKDGSLLILVKGRLIKPVSLVFQYIVHINGKIHIDIVRLVYQGNLTLVGGGTHRSRVASQLKVLQVNGKRQGFDLGSNPDFIICTVKLSLHGGILPLFANHHSGKFVFRTI